FCGSFWSAYQGQARPLLWVAELKKLEDLPLNNLWLKRQDTVNPTGSPRHSSGERMPGRLEGRYVYYLVNVRDREPRMDVLIVEAGASQSLDLNAFRHDLTVLELMLGQRLDGGILYGISGHEVVCAKKIFPHSSMARSNNAPAIPHGAE